MVKIVVPLSGGKDSQACLQLALETHHQNDVMGLFCDTQFEHPLTYAHIDQLRDHYGVKIHRLCAGSVADKVRKYKMFPMGGARHCTEYLKIQPSKLYYKELAEEQGEFEVWYGMRSGESRERSARYAHIVDTTTYHPHEVIATYPKYLGAMGVRFRLPILEWTTEDVVSYLTGRANPLYGQGFNRVGCFPCLAGGDGSKAKAFGHDETGAAHYAIVQQLEAEIGQSVWKSETGKSRMDGKQKEIDFGGCAICAM